MHGVKSNAIAVDPRSVPLEARKQRADVFVALNDKIFNQSST
jgi:hypothetical protein